jgi:hypothetical protein
MKTYPIILIREKSVGNYQNEILNMQIEKRLINHYRRWKIDLEYGDQFLKFKNRCIDAINRLIGDYLVLNSDVDEKFFEILNLHKAAEPYVKKSQTRNIYPALTNITSPFVYTERGFGDTEIYKCVKNCEDSKELAAALQFLFWALEEKDGEAQNLIFELVRQIRKSSRLTPSASFQIHQKGTQVIIYPQGDQFLDEGIINYVLAGLEDYPKAARQFEQALKIYQSGEVSQYRNLLDNLRLAIEEVLKKVLHNERTLENQKEILLARLKNHGLHVQVRNMYQQLLFCFYCHYQNNAVKHREDYSLDEVEFMIYLTGSFIRLILQLERENHSSYSK